MKPATDWREQIAPDEAAKLEAHARTVAAIAARVASKNASAPSRALHAKGQAGMRARFEVFGDLPDHLRQGAFAEPKTYAAYVRFSNGAAARQPDRTNDVRGIAVKLVGVDGEKLIPGLESAKTQDFLAIRSPVTPFRNADEFVALLVAAENKWLLLPRLIGALGFGRTFEVLPKLAKGLAAPLPSLATARFWSALPIAWGPYAARYSFIPRASAGGQTKTPADLEAELAERLRTAAVEYDFAVQLYVDETRTPIEDASVDWNEADAPFTTVGRLTLPAVDLAAAEARAVSAYVETLSFDPWHARREHRPLGNMMRARNAAYRVSTQARNAAREPDGTESP
jgi:hypothetical protein